MKKHWKKILICLILVMICFTLISCKEKPIEEKVTGTYSSENNFQYNSTIRIEETGKHKIKFFYYYQINTNVNGNVTNNRVMYGYWKLDTNNVDLSSNTYRLKLTVIYDSNLPSSESYTSYTINISTNLKYTECFFNGFLMKKIHD